MQNSKKPPLCDLLWAGSKPDAHARYAEARSRSPICFDEKQKSWIVLGYEASVACLKDTERLSNDPVAEFDPFVVGGDPPDHSKYRRILQDSVRAFEKGAVVAFANGWIDGFLARLKPGTVFDAVADFAVPLVDDMAGHMVGFTREEIEHFQTLRPANRAHVRAFDEVAGDFFASILKSESPGNRTGALWEFLDALQESRLNEREATSLLRLLWIGGTATSNLFNPSALHLLIRHETVKAELQKNAALVPAFVSEALRLEGPTTTVPRRAKTCFELCGQQIRENDSLQICLLSANSDPAFFPNPKTIDLSRPLSRQIAFGFGIHHCLGGYIARALAETVVGRVLRDLPSLTEAEPLESLEYEEGNLRGLKRLLLACR
jgi:cytochrome P450